MASVLSSDPLLHVECAGARLRAWRPEDLESLVANASHADVSRGLRFSHTHILLQAAIDGRGVALGQLALAADDLAAGRLVAPFTLKLPTGYAYYLVYLPGAAEQPKIKAFREWVMSETADDRPVLA